MVPYVTCVIADSSLWWTVLLSPASAKLSVSDRSWRACPPLEMCIGTWREKKGKKKRKNNLWVWDKARLGWWTSEHMECSRGPVWRVTNLLQFGEIKFFRNNHGPGYTNTISMRASGIGRDWSEFLWERAEALGLNTSAFWKLERKQNRFHFIWSYSDHISVIYLYYIIITLFQQYCWRMSTWRWQTCS